MLTMDLQAHGLSETLAREYAAFQTILAEIYPDVETVIAEKKGDVPINPIYLFNCCVRLHGKEEASSLWDKARVRAEHLEYPLSKKYRGVWRSFKEGKSIWKRIDTDSLPEAIHHAKRDLGSKTYSVVFDNEEKVYFLHDCPSIGAW